jgi:hypothetical protein
MEVTIDVRTISDNELVINTADMTEMSDGAYKYIFTSYDEDLDYLFICKAESGDRVFAVNDRVEDQIKTITTKDLKLSTNKATIVTGADGVKTVTIFDNDGLTPITIHTVEPDMMDRTPVPI